MRRRHAGPLSQRAPLRVPTSPGAHGAVLRSAEFRGGPFVLARAGLLDGMRCTLHWEHIPAFAEDLPEGRGSPDPCTRSTVTASLVPVGIAAFDMMLALVIRDHGRGPRASRERLVPTRPHARGGRRRSGWSRPSVSACETSASSASSRRSTATSTVESRAASWRRPPACPNASSNASSRLSWGCTAHDYALRQRLAHAGRLRRETSLCREGDRTGRRFRVRLRAA